jgi:hypothetical protein
LLYYITVKFNILLAVVFTGNIFTEKNTWWKSILIVRQKEKAGFKYNDGI